MKSRLRRLLAIGLTLLLTVNLFAVCGWSASALEEPLAPGDQVASWDHKDLLNATDRSVMGVLSYDDSQKDLVGTELNAGSTNYNSMNAISASGITLKEGHTIRLALKMFYPNGTAGAGPFFRIYASGSKKIADISLGLAAYQAAPTLQDETYGYFYKEINFDVVVDSTKAGTDGYCAAAENTGITQWFSVSGITDLSTTPVQFYGFKAYDVTDNQKLYEFSGQQIAALGLNADLIESKGLAKTDLYASAACHTDSVGITTLDVGTNAATSAFMKYDAFFPASGAKVNDEIEYGIEFWAKNGLTDTEQLTLQYQVRDQSNAPTNFGSAVLKGDGYSALSANRNVDYGYEYKTFTGTVVLNETVAGVLQSQNAKGFNMMIGGSYAQRDWKNYPVTVYRYYIYNKTQQVYYADVKGAELISTGGNGAQNVNVTATVGKTDFALDGYLYPNQSVTFSTLSATLPQAGQYTMNFALQGTVGHDYTVSAITTDGVPLVTSVFTATGEAQSVELNLDSVGDQEVTFAITTGASALSVSEIVLTFAQEFAPPQVGEVIASFDHSDLLDATNRAETNTTNYTGAPQTIIGTELNAGSSNYNSMNAVSVSNVTLTEGHTLRFVQRMYCPNGIAGTGPFFRIYASGNKKVADTALGTTTYNNAAEKRDETYGYLYKEITYDVVVDSTKGGTDGYCVAAENTGLSHWFFVSGVTDMAANPLRFYGLEAYDLTTGELLYEITGEQIANAGLNPQKVEEKGVAKTDLVVSLVQTERVGITTVANGTNTATSAFMKFDRFSPAPQAQAGDVIEYGVEFWAPNGLTDSDYLTFQYQVRDSANKSTNFGTAELKEADFLALDVEYDTTYGYAYKTFASTFTLTQEVANVLQSDNAKGFNMLIGGGYAARDWESYPVNLYRFYIYNRTQGVYYTDVDGVQLYSQGGSGTVNDYVTVTSGSSEYADDCYVYAETTANFGGLGSLLSAEGAYTYRFSVKGQAGKTYTLSAITEGLQYPTKVTFDATGETQEVALNFNAKPLQSAYFLVTTPDATLTVDSVELVYAGERVADEVIQAIAALNREITLEDTEEVIAARAAYQALTDTEKGYVNNLPMLEAAEATLNQLTADKVILLIEALPTALSLSDKETVAAARQAFDDLTEAQQALVSNIEKLITAERDLNHVESLIAAVDALPEAQDLTLENELALVAAQASYNALSQSALAMLPSATADKLNALNQKLAQIRPAGTPAPMTSAYWTENFSSEGSVANWSASGATLSLESDALKVQAAAGVAKISSTRYPMEVQIPLRTGSLIYIKAENPRAVTALSVVLTDAAGKTATFSLNPDKLDASGYARYCLPMNQATETQEGYNGAAVQVDLVVETTEACTLWVDSLDFKLYDDANWSLWIYDYSVEPGDYSIAVLPDLQNANVYHADKMDNMMRWIVNNTKKENILFTLDVGDITWNGHQGASNANAVNEFKTSDKTFSILDQAGLNYSISYGNHDYTPGSPRSTELYNQYFPLSRFEKMSTFGGAMEAGKSDNIYYCFEVEGIRYMVMALEFAPRTETFEWANQVISQHPDYNVIVTTHSYIDGESNYSDGASGHGVTGKNIWDKLIRKQKNIFMVICGHECNEPDPGSMDYRVDMGDHGNLVYQYMVNSQDIDTSLKETPLLLMRFSNGGNTINFNYFSVETGAAFKEVNQFTLQLPEGQLITPANEVMRTIQALPQEITPADAEAVEAARLAYNSLTESQKALVKEELLAKLVAAEEALAINPDEVIANQVMAQIEALEVLTLEDKAAVEAARAAYEALTENQKALVTNLSKLTAAEEAVVALEEAAQAAADKVIANQVMAQIEALEVLTLDDKAAVEAARAAYEALTENQKALVTNLSKLTAAEEAVVALEEAAQAAADKAAAQAVIDAIDALTQESTEEDVAAARAAYEVLTEAQKALVAQETLAKLVALEEALAQPSIFYGDIDGNGTVDAADALKALQHAVKLITLEGEAFSAGDVDGNEKVDAADALLMLQHTVKLIDKFPVEG